VTPDSLRVSDEEGRVRAVGTSNLRSLEVSLGNPVRAGHVAKGALIGGLIVGGLVAATGAGGDNRAQGDAGFAAVILAPVGALIGGGWAALRAREDWQPLPVASLGNVGAPSASAHPTFVPPAKSKGKRIGIGALVGGAAGAAFVQTQRSSSPKFGQYLVSVVPGMLVGGGIGALWP
jgi:hypothetical protein